MSDTQKDKNTLRIKDSDNKFRLNFKGFLKNEHHSFVVEKTEKLASALYMVTGFIPGDDPLRTRLRVCAVDLVSATTGKGDDGVVDGNRFASQCLEIGTILKLAERAGFISSMNAGVLSDEYADLARFVKTHAEKIFGMGALYTPVDDNTSAPVAPKKTSSSRTSATPPSTNAKKTPSRTVSNKRQNTRRDAILRLLDKKDRISIKDAAASIKDCSEKTIQRELIALVEEGVLLKEGERRWSTYRRA